MCVLRIFFFLPTRTPFDAAVLLARFFFFVVMLALLFLFAASGDVSAEGGITKRNDNEKENGGGSRYVTRCVYVLEPLLGDAGLIPLFCAAFFFPVLFE